MAKVATKKRVVPIKKKTLGLVQYERLPTNVFLVARLPATAAAQKRQLHKYATQHRMGKKYTVVDSIVNDPEAITAILNRLAKRWKAFPYGSAKGLYEGSIRGFRSHWRAILKEHPAALLFDLALAEKESQEKQSAIEKLESDNDVLQARIIGLKDQLDKLKATYINACMDISLVEETYSQNRRLQLRIYQLEDEDSAESELRESDYDESEEDDSLFGDDLPIRCTGSYTVMLKRDMSDEMCECPDCGISYSLEELFAVDDERSDLRPPRHPAIAGSIPAHRPR